MGSKNLNEKIMECISNPAKSRLMIEIMRRGKVTASIWLKVRGYPPNDALSLFETNDR